MSCHLVGKTSSVFKEHGETVQSMHCVLCILHHVKNHNCHFSCICSCHVCLGVKLRNIATVKFLGGTCFKIVVGHW